MPLTKSKGLARAQELYEDPSARAKELKAEGKKVIGYWCCEVPVEYLTAADLVPYRMLGDVNEPITRADAYLETTACPYIRSCLDLALKGRYDFLDGFIVPHTCYNVLWQYDIWAHWLDFPWRHFLNLPHATYPSCFKQFEVNLGFFKEKIGQLIGHEISDQRLVEAIRLHNQNRALLRELYQLRKQDPPLLAGTEVTKIAVAGRGIPVAEYNELLREVIEEVKDRRNGPGKKPRVLVWGNHIDNTAFFGLVEDGEGNVVFDDTCLGARCFWYDVETDGDPVRSLAERYLGKVPCPCIHKHREGTFKEDMENRFGYLLDFAKEYDVKGLIMYVIRYCDYTEYDAPGVRNFFEEAGFPVLHIEDDYSVTTIGQLKTRVQAFLEMIG